MRPDFQRVRISLGASLTPVVRILMWINGLAYLFLALAERREMGTPGFGLPYNKLLISLFGLVPRSVVHDLALWQPITYMFLHQEFLHLLVNMLALWWFGADIERRF